jgi:hypothetical protein
MPRLPSFFAGVVSGAALLYVAMNFHVLRAGDGFHLVAKQPPRLSDVYVDIRGFSMADWANHPQLAAALVQSNREYLLGGSAAGAFQENAKQLLPAWPER